MLTIFVWQVGPGDKSVTLESLDGERAMLVKTGTGDCCVVKAAWKGYTAGEGKCSFLYNT